MNSGPANILGAMALKTPDEHRAVVTWTGAGEPITLKIYSSTGEVAAVSLSPVRALELARELSGARCDRDQDRVLGIALAGLTPPAAVDLDARSRPDLL